jgi:hypothetical protein
MKRTIATILIVAGLGTPAFANDQLARSVGVEPGTFSTSELARLKAALDDGDVARIRAARQVGNNERVSTQNYGKGPGHQQLARSAGVDSDRFTTAQIAQLRAAEADEDRHTAAYIRRSTSRTVVGGFSTSDVRTSSGHVQMARSLGVDPDQHSTMELIRLREDRWSD